jgi:hypothetical protein
MKPLMPSHKEVEESAQESRIRRNIGNTHSHGVKGGLWCIAMALFSSGIFGQQLRYPFTPKNMEITYNISQRQSMIQ